MKECGSWEDIKVPLSQCNALIALIFPESVPVVQPGFGAECILLPACQPAEPVSPQPHCGHDGIAGAGLEQASARDVHEAEIRELEDIITAALALKHK